MIIAVLLIVYCYNVNRQNIENPNQYTKKLLKEPPSGSLPPLKGKPSRGYPVIFASSITALLQLSFKFWCYRSLIGLGTDQHGKYYLQHLNRCCYLCLVDHSLYILLYIYYRSIQRGSYENLQRNWTYIHGVHLVKGTRRIHVETSSSSLRL